MTLSRRKLLQGSVSAVLTLPQVTISPAGRVPLTAIVTVQGQAPVTFREVDGQDLGTYNDPAGRFSQRCILTRNAALPGFAALFRPDVSGGREEVVFELGTLFAAGVGHLGVYSVDIMAGSALLFRQTMPLTFGGTAPAHYWRSRWRWNPTPRPPTGATASALIAAGLLPNYSEAITGGFTPASPVSAYAPMGLAGLTGDMRGTGERPEIGPVTEPQADWICTGRASALATMLAQAEASGTFPWHLRDETTGAPIDTFAYPKASMYGQPDAGAVPYMPMSFALDGKVVPDAAHEPALAYLPFLLTGDPYYLEEQQSAVNFNIVCQSVNGRAFDVYFAIRAHAWSLRSAAQAAKVTPDTVPAWLLPRSYFVRHLNDNRDWMLANYVNNTVAPYPMFRTIEKTFGDNDESPAAPSGTYCQDYMEEFEAFILSWVVRIGFADWRPIFDWKIQNTIARTNGTSGWVRAISTPYRQILRASRADPWLPDWASSWALTSQRYGWVVGDPNVLPISGDDISYPSYSRGVLAAAQGMSVPGAADCYSWLDGQLRTALTTRRYIARKWAIAP